MENRDHVTEVSLSFWNVSVENVEESMSVRGYFVGTFGNLIKVSLLAGEFQSKMEHHHVVVILLQYDFFLVKTNSFL